MRKTGPSIQASSRLAQSQSFIHVRLRGGNTYIGRASANGQDSLLLRLPAEMRNRIYTMALQAECILIRSKYLTAFDMTVALRSCCSSTSPTHSQTWSEGSTVVTVVSQHMRAITRCAEPLFCTIFKSTTTQLNKQYR